MQVKNIDVAYRMATMPMILGDLGWPWENLSNSHTSGKVACIIDDMFINVLQDSPNVIFRISVQQLTRFQLT